MASVPPADSRVAIVLLQLACALAAGVALHLLLRPLRLAHPPALTAPAARDPDHPGPYREQLRALAQALPIGVLVVDGDRVFWANDALRRQLGWNHADAGADDAQGRSAASLFVDGDQARQVLESSAACDVAVELLRADGSRHGARLKGCSVALGPRRPRLLLVSDLTPSEENASRLVEQREELQAMARHLITLQEEERTALSRELHDDVGQAITAMKLCAMALVDDNRERRLATVEEIAGIADQTVVKLRNIALLLRPPQLDALGLEAALRSQAESMFRGRQVQLGMTLAPLDRRPDPAVELACFRIAQEALTNALRHSGATQVSLSLAAAGDTLELSVEDNGRGFEPGHLQGLGMVTMRERAQQLEGVLQVGPGHAAGTCIRVRLPMRSLLAN